MRIKHIQAIKNQAKEILFNCVDMNGDVIDLTGISGTFTITKETPGSTSTVILTKSMEIVSAIEGKSKVELTDAELLIDILTYQYILTLEYATGENRVIFAGEFIVSGDYVTTRIEEINKIFGLNYDNYIMESALEYARTEASKNGFESVVNDVAQQTDMIDVCSYIQDSNYDGVVDASDINIYQYQTVSPYTVEDLNAHIVSLELDNPIKPFIQLDAEYPSSEYKMRVEYKVGSDSYDNLQTYKELLENWYVLKYLFENLEPYKLQHGMTTKDINGINVTYDQAGITEFQKKIQNKVAYYIMKTLPFTKCQYNNAGEGGLIRDVLISKTYSN